MNRYYLFESNKNQELSGSNEVIIVLPDIYCQTDYSKDTVERFANTFKKPVFILDYFSLSTNKANVIDQEDKGAAHSLMKNFDANAFIPFFQKVLGEIKTEYPDIRSFIVIGFCFGGRLAYITGGEPGVSKIFSFYGAGPNTPDYIEGKTPIEYLISKRGQSDLVVHSFFGINDQSIPEEDRQKVKDLLSGAGIAYTPHKYDAGHAYFQEGRANFDAPASQASWEVLKTEI